MVRLSRHAALAGVSAVALAFATQAASAASTSTATPIKHLVVIFQENVSFDHYFATYPKAANPDGEPAFTAAADTPTDIDTLAHAGLLDNNPNDQRAERRGCGRPFRLDRTQAGTADQNHGYTAEQAAFNDFKMDLFPKFTGKGNKDGAGAFGNKGLVMGYYDGNTVTALWNYAQHYAMNDASFSSTFGPSTPGAINLVSGQTNGMLLPPGYKLEKDGTYDGGRVVPDGNGNWTMISDLDPTDDVCSNPKYPTALMVGKNIGDMLNAKGITWGFFEGGFDLTLKNADGSTGCGRTTTSSLINVKSGDYIPHHQPFQYYLSTANPKHVRPASADVIGTSNDGGANHQYDLHDFWAALAAGNFPTVTFLKAPPTRTAMPATPTRSTNRNSSPMRSTRSSRARSGSRPPSSSSTTTRTAGTTMPTRWSIRRRSRSRATTCSTATPAPTASRSPASTASRPRAAAATAPASRC